MRRPLFQEISSIKMENLTTKPLTKWKIDKFSFFFSVRQLDDILVQILDSRHVVLAEADEGVPASVVGRHHGLRLVRVLEAERVADLVQRGLQ